jgi:hypothetical protein
MIRNSSRRPTISSSAPPILGTCASEPAQGGIALQTKELPQAGIYAKLGESGLANDLKNKALYKLGWCQAQSGDFAGAVKTYSKIDKNAGSPTLPSAIAQRGLAPAKQTTPPPSRTSTRLSTPISTRRSAAGHATESARPRPAAGLQRHDGAFRKLLEEYLRAPPLDRPTFGSGGRL